MSRAFVKEDVDLPEAEKFCEFRAYSGKSRFEVEPSVLFSSNDLGTVLSWAEGQLGYYQVRDAAGKMLAEVDAV
jgi:hypothetical protein